MISKFNSKPLAILLIASMILSMFTFAPQAKAADEFDGLRAKWQAFLVGESLDPADPDIAAEISIITKTANDYWTAMDTSPSRTSLWSDMSDWKRSSTITNNYKRLLAMATAYATTGSSLQGSEALANDIVSGLDWMYANHYNASLPEIDNWWDWEIGTPLRLNDIMVLMYDQLSPEQISNYISVIDKWCPNAEKRVINNAAETGANRADKAQVLVIRGIVGKLGSKIAEGRDALSQIFPYVTSGDGYYTDGSFIQHGYVAYTGSYGYVLLYDMAKMFYILNGSTWTITDPEASNVYDWVTNSYQPLMYKGAMMDMTAGRKLSREGEQDHTNGRSVALAILLLSEGAPVDQASEFKSMVKAWVQADTTFTNYYTDLPTVSVYLTSLLKSTMNDSSILPSEELVKTQVFANMDRVVHLRSGFGIGLSMFSTRISAFEYGNGENLKAWWTGVGMTQLYNNDLNQYSQNYWATVNPYRLPGTTTDGSGSGKPIDWHNYANPNTWVGGSSVDELYSTAGMQFSLSQNTGSPLQGKKSWFMFGDKMVALGTGITNTNDANVETIVDNRKLNSSGDNVLTVNGVAKSSELGWSETMTNVQWAHLGGDTPGSDIGYYFPVTADVYGLRESRTGTWRDINQGGSTTPYTNNYLNLAFEHGVNPTDASYAYAVLPNKSAEDMAKYASHPDITILENSADVQAVKDTSLHAVGANFWNDAATTVSVDGTNFITSDKKASITTLESNNQIDIGISDPTQSNEGTINIEINRSASGPIQLDQGITVTQYSPTIKMTVDVKGSSGKTFNAKFNLGSSEVVVPASADAYVQDGASANANFGSTTALSVKSDGTGNKKHMYLKFDLSSIKGAVADAKVQLVPISEGNSKVSHQANLVSHTWDETNITWNNQPTAGELLATWTVPTKGTPLQFDVTSAVNHSLAADKQLSLQISQPASKGSKREISYASRENETTAYRPALVLQLIPEAPVLTNATANDSQVTLSWPLVSGATRYTIKYGTAPGSYMETIHVTDVSSTNKFTVTGLINGTTYYFVVSAVNDAGESAMSNEMSAVPKLQLNPHVTLKATDDAYVRDGSYANTNYGSAATMMVKADGAGYNRSSFVKYDLSSITGAVTSAKIQLVPTFEGKEGIINQVNLVTDSTWSQSTLTWNNQPTVSTLLSSYTVPTVGTLVEIDVTDQVIEALAAAADKKLSIRVISPMIQGSNGDVSYGTKEHGNKSYQPVIVIN